jgi:hypothetical protein
MEKRVKLMTEAEIDDMIEDIIEDAEWKEV